MTLAASPPSVAIVGGGLAGLAAAVALGTSGCQVELIEARRYLGGRAASFRDPAGGALIDHCQHVSMGCCTNLADFCQRTASVDFFHREPTLHFIGPDGHDYPLTASRWLPPPLHLLPGFWRLKYLTVFDRLAIGRALWKLMRMRRDDDANEPSVGAWLRQQRQSENAIARFWNVLLVSTLGEELDRAALSAARKVIIDGFLAAREAAVVQVPRRPLGTLYDETLEPWCAAHGVQVRLNSPIQQVTGDDRGLCIVGDRWSLRPDYVILAVPWTNVGQLLSASLRGQLPWLKGLTHFDSAPISSVHLWFDRPISDLPHAVLVDRMSQWIFRRAGDAADGDSHGHYYQVVISASRELAGRDRQQIIEQVRSELAEIWPQTVRANLLRARVVTQHDAVFSAKPRLDRLRPSQQTPIKGLLVAGDWTATHWPATMESAVRSGYLAAEAVLRQCGAPRRFLVPELPRSWLARWLIRDEN